MKENQNGASGPSNLFKELLPAVEVSATSPVIIAGPCSAESREQVLDTALQLKETGISVFRAGVWKPRTHPGCFEGRGSRALGWLGEVKALTGLPVATEIASSSHLAEALDGGIDILWLGARTTTNPFAVQEIADAAKSWAEANGRDVASLRFLVKNPANQDLELWIGAIQRLYNAGIRHITAIHRGFSVYGNTSYRNPPQWQIPMELRRRIGPKLQILCDPSHIGGKKELIEPIAQQAIDRGFHGLIIESHCNPAEALSDASQQVTPARLKEILDRLVWRHEDTETVTLANLRAQIDQLDDELMTLMQRRMEVARETGDFKMRHSMAVVQPERYESMMERRAAQAPGLGLSPEFVRALLATIHEESVRQQLASRSGGGDGSGGKDGREGRDGR